MTDEKILEIAEPFGAFERGDAQGHKRIAFARAVLAAAPAAPAAEPIDMVLHCPKCLMQHIDAEETDAQYTARLKAAARALDGRLLPHRWTNSPHLSHLCHGCGHVWRPADVATNGVLAVKTTGKADSPAAAPGAVPAAPAVTAPIEPRWYCVDSDGVAILCCDEDDARAGCAHYDTVYPKVAPHRAVLLGDVAAERDRCCAIVMRAPFEQPECDEDGDEVATAIKAMAFDICSQIRGHVKLQFDGEQAELDLKPEGK